MNGIDLGRAAAASQALLSASLSDGASWDVPVPGLRWTVAETAAHLADVLLAFATDLAAGPRELRRDGPCVSPETDPADLVASVGAHATVLAAVVDASGPEARGWHPLGLADPDGFAAMGCDELLVHTDDAARGLGRVFTPPAGLAEAVLRRLFPWAPAGGDPWATLRWANGRAELPGHGRLEPWRWHCAPLDEWDGRAPSV